mmetsp:Transcript_142012/g.370138  ORF Transcript_142012/g.370138 Transcript_142012/m.370138 type:complete len:279 (+) Transcript_142012:579-1415(+)
MVHIAGVPVVTLPSSVVLHVARWYWRGVRTIACRFLESQRRQCIRVLVWTHRGLRHANEGRPAAHLATVSSVNTVAIGDVEHALVELRLGARFQGETPTGLLPHQATSVVVTRHVHYATVALIAAPTLVRLDIANRHGMPIRTSRQDTLWRCLPLRHPGWVRVVRRAACNRCVAFMRRQAAHDATLARPHVLASRNVDVTSRLDKRGAWNDDGATQELWLFKATIRSLTTVDRAACVALITRPAHRSAGFDVAWDDRARIRAFTILHLPSQVLLRIHV